MAPAGACNGTKSTSSGRNKGREYLLLVFVNMMKKGLEGA
jgi:hypothetical protein